MTYKISVLIGITLLMVTIGVASQGQSVDAGERTWEMNAAASFTGLWRSIQASDGSLATYSISDVDRDGVFEIRTHEFFFSFCRNNGGDFGIIGGTATFNDARLLVEEGALTCSNGAVLNFNRFYEYIPRDDILVSRFLTLEAVPEVLHRISSR